MSKEEKLYNDLQKHILEINKELCLIKNDSANHDVREIPGSIEENDEHNREISFKKTAYEISELIDFYNELDLIIKNSNDNLQDIYKKVSKRLVKLFGSKYVEFMVLKDNFLEYSYIAIPDILMNLTHRLTGISAVIGMNIPLFEGSMYREFIIRAEPRELISFEDRLKSFRDFIEPDSEENIFKRDHVAPVLMKFFGYDYIFQVPLIINGRIFGFFSFLQKGRFTERVKADIIMLSGKLAHLLSIKKMEQERRDFCKKINQPVVFIDVKHGECSGHTFIVSDVNDEFIKIISVRRENIVKKPVFRIMPDLYDPLNKIFYDVYTTGNPDVVDIYYGEKHRVYRSFVSRTESGTLMMIGEDVTENMKMVHYDSLTEVYNRYTFIEKSETALVNADKNNAVAAMFFIDINDLKPVNDRFGHEAGDLYLRTIASALKNTIRNRDIIGRFGGDEFVILSVINDRKNAERIAGKISRAINSVHIEIEGGVIKGSASIGIACRVKNSTEDIEDLIHRSDKAMYVSKREGRNYHFSESLSA